MFYDATTFMKETGKKETGDKKASAEELIDAILLYLYLQSPL